MRRLSVFSPYSTAGHVAAAVGAVMLHGSIAAWAMVPDAPIVIPQQQMIQVSMVAPSVVAQKPLPQPEAATQPVSTKVLPKPEGMVKAQPKPQPVQKAEKKPEHKHEPQPPRPQTRTLMTSGMVATDARRKESAIVRPLPADYLNNPPPHYPEQARRRKQQGTVMLDVQVSTAGSPRQVAVGRSSGVQSLDEAALDAVRRWKFIPARRGSEIIEASVRVPVTFRLN